MNFASSRARNQRAAPHVSQSEHRHNQQLRYQADRERLEALWAADSEVKITVRVPSTDIAPIEFRHAFILNIQVAVMSALKTGLIDQGAAQECWRALPSLAVRT